MQATRQNTRQLVSDASEILEWYTQGAEWSILNYGPGILWFSYTPGVDAAPGEVQSTKLESGFSFTDSTSATRFLQLSLHAEAGNLTYCLNTNQRYPAGALPPGGGGGGGGIDDAPVDGELYGRRNAAWDPAASKAEVDAKVNKAGDTMSGYLIIRTVASTLALILDDPAGVLANIAYSKAGANAWELLAAFSGVNEWFALRRYNPDGSLADMPIMVDRATGLIRLNPLSEPLFLPADPTEDLHAVTKRYVDQVGLPGPTQTLALNPGDWTGTSTLQYRKVGGGGAFIEMFGTLARVSGNPIAPGTWFLVGNFPPEYRPAAGMQTQYRLVLCNFGPPATVGILVYQTNGDLMIRVDVQSTSSYFTETFALSI